MIKDIATLMVKDCVLLWRDRSLLFIVLLWLAPLGGLVNAPTLDDMPGLSQPGQRNASSAAQKRWHHRSGATAGNPVVTHSWFSVSSDADFNARDDRTPALPNVTVGVIGDAPQINDNHFTWRPIKDAEYGLFAIQQGTVDLLLETPEIAGPQRYEVMTIVFDKNIARSRDAADQLHRALRKADATVKKQRILTIGKIAKSDHNWLLASLENHYDKRIDDTPAAMDMKLWGIGGALMLASALAGSLVMLIMVEENSQHTLPLILVCALDRRTIFGSKLLFCILPTLTAIAAAIVKLWRATPTPPSGLIEQIGYFGTALIAAALFVLSASIILVATGGRSRNNVEAVAKVGGPLILLGFLVIAAVIPVARFEPGLRLLPMSNLILCLNELRQSAPSPAVIATCLISSGLFCWGLLNIAPRALRCEEGLAGEVGGTEPKLDGFLMVLLSSVVVCLLQNLFAIPLGIVFPSAGIPASIGILSLGALIGFKWRRIRFVEAAAVKRCEWPYVASAVVVGTATAYVFASVGWLPPAALTMLGHWPFVLIIACAIIEELALRGVFIDALEDHFSWFTISAIMICVSAAIHPMGNIWILFAILSAVLTMVRLVSKSVIPCVILRVVHVVILYAVWGRILQ